MEGLLGNCGAVTNKLSPFPEEHGNETGLAHSTWSMKQEQVIFVGNEAVLKGSIQVVFCWIWCMCMCVYINVCNWINMQWCSGVGHLVI